MQICCCLWGGTFNPIVPIYRTTPKQWRDSRSLKESPRSVARGYIEFFEPDAYIEAKTGLLEEAGLESFRTPHAFQTRAILLEDMITDRNKRGWNEPCLGLSIIDAMAQVYRDEQRFQLRKPSPSFLVKSQPGNALAEIMFGVYPADRGIDYISKSYENVFSPDIVDPTPAIWRNVFLEGSFTPLKLTRHKIETTRNWHDDLVIFVFDPENPLDVIDLWNIKLEPNPILPVPLMWWGELLDDLRRVLMDQHQPVRGNPSGLMHRGTVEFARSISTEDAEHLAEMLKEGMPTGGFSVKYWRTKIWQPKSEDHFLSHRRLIATVNERREELAVDQSGLSTKFAVASPDFAERYSGGEMRWVNSLKISYVPDESISTVLPFNTFDPEWPRRRGYSESAMIGSEGWSFPQRWKDWSQSVALMSGEQAVASSLDRLGINAKLSEPGHIAKQIIDHLGGIRGIYLLKNERTLMMLNEMAGGIRRKGTDGASEEIFDRRSRSVKDWTDLISRLKTQKMAPNITLQNFTDKGVIQLGLRTTCPNCKSTNWHSLSIADYSLNCERCRRDYRFPQANLQKQNGNWSYRAVGPFAVPDFARGSYGALLALNVIGSMGMSMCRMSFSTAMSLTFDGIEAEADYVAWWTSDRSEQNIPPELVVGEAKSFGRGDLLKESDFTKLRAIARKIPGTTFVISVLRDHFTKNEKVLLKKFSIWCRRGSEQDRPLGNVVLLTSRELFFEFSLDATWRDLGEPYATFVERYRNTHTLKGLAEATQSIYLGLPLFYEDMDAKLKIRAQRLTNRQKNKA